MVLTMAAVRNAALDVERRLYHPAAVLRVGPAAYLAAMHEIVAATGSRGIPIGHFDWDGWWPEEPTFVGLELLRDEWLPPDVWRLTDADATLLYDCRMKL